MNGGLKVQNLPLLLISNQFVDTLGLYKKERSKENQFSPNKLLANPEQPYILNATDLIFFRWKQSHLLFPYKKYVSIVSSVKSSDFIM